MNRIQRYLLVALLTASACLDGSSQHVSASREAITSCVTLVASADTMLSNPPMDHNFGQMPILRAGGKDESLVQFDLGSIPSAAALDRATLMLYVSGSDSTAPVNAHRATSPWAEGSTTYASFGQHYDLAILGAITTTSVNVQKSIDLTPQVKSWVMGAQPNYGLLLETSATKKTIFVSREGGTTGQKPQLQVCYTLPDNHCAPNPCENGATCENGSSSYTCHCAPGYTGATCATPIDNCANNPCLHGGTCANGINTYSCTCLLGYTGPSCETLIDNCATSPCENAGVCNNGIGSYTCECVPGFTGGNCETLVDNCAAIPCQNGGTCANGVNSYSCTCATGFTGANCEINIDDCASQPCHNGGTCIDGINAYTCNCPPDWGGATCDVNLSSCSQHPCLNGSTCTNGYGNYTCTCAAGYSGTNCEIDINDCTVNRCQNGGICVDGVNSYTCTCATGYRGANCELFGCAGAPDGTACDDGSACTHDDVCASGACTGTPFVCPGVDVCHVAVCDPSSTPLQCVAAAVPDGTPFDWGVTQLVGEQTFDFGGGDITSIPVFAFLPETCTCQAGVLVCPPLRCSQWSITINGVTAPEDFFVPGAVCDAWVPM